MPSDDPSIDPDQQQEQDQEQEPDEDFLQLEKEIASTLSDLSDPSNILLADFSLEYDKLARALRGAHENELRVEKKCLSLVNEAASIKEKARNEAGEQDELHSRKLHLTTEIEEAWKGVKVAHEKSTDRRKNVTTIRKRNDELVEKLKQGSGWTESQKRALQNHERDERELVQELDKEMKALKAMRGEIGQLLLRVQKEEEIRNTIKSETVILLSNINSKETETEQESARYGTLTKLLDDKRDAVEHANNRLRTTHTKVKEGNSGIQELERKLRSAKEQMEGYLEKYDVLFHQSKSTTFSLDGQVSKNESVRTDVETIQKSIQEKIFDRISVVKESKKINKLIGAAKKRLKSIEHLFNKAEDKRKVLVNEIGTMRDDKEIAKKSVDTNKKAADALIREKVVLTSDAGSVAERITKVNLICKVNSNARKNYEVEISSFISQARTQREIIERLEIDVKKYDGESKNAHSEYYAALEEVKYNDVKCTEIQRKILDSNSRLKQQQNLYEQVRSERNLYSKQLLEAKEDISTMKILFRSMNHDINQMKDEITSKDHALVKEHFDHHKVEKQKTTTRNELTKVRKQIESSQQIQTSQLIEIQKLGAIIQEAEEERQRQKKELNAVVGERDILTAQLVRRGEELEQIYEKIKINRTKLRQGEKAYDNNRNIENGIHSTIGELLERLGNIKTDGDQLPILKTELYRLERELFQEKAKTKALRDESTKPLNVHRWRKLQDSDPDRHAQIVRIQELQKVLISKTEAVVEKDLIIQDKERLYVELKNILARQPGPEVAEQLEVYGTNLKSKKRQMKAMRSELLMYKQQVIEYRTDLDQVRQSLSLLQDKYFNMLRRGQGQGPPRGQSAESGYSDGMQGYNNSYSNQNENNAYNNVSDDNNENVNQQYNPRDGIENQSVTPFVAGAESPYGSSRGGETPLPPLVPNGRPGTSQGENNSMNEGGLNAWEEKSEIVEKTEQ